MNKEVETDKSVMSMEGSGNTDEFKVSECELIKKENSNWIEIKQLEDNNDLKDMNDEENVKNEENVETVKHEVESKEKKSTVDKKEDRGVEAVTKDGAVDQKSLTNYCEAKMDENVLEKPNQVIAKFEFPETPTQIEENFPGEGEEETETIHLIEETIIIAAVPPSEETGKSLNQETIVYNLIEYTDSTLSKPPSLIPPICSPPAEECPDLPLQQSQNDSPSRRNSSDPQQTNNVEPLKPLPEPKKRSLIEDIYDDWSDGNAEEEEVSLKVDDAVEHQLKTLLDEKSSKSPKTKTQKAPSSPKQCPQSQKILLESQAKTSLNDAHDPESAPLNQDGKEGKKPSERLDEPSADSKELLAILEGDVEPDWSDLKPPTLTVEANSDENLKQVEHNSPPKLDPLVERQLALKQLLELPMASKKPRISPRKSPVVPKQIFDEDESVEEVKIDETRSGRKRKPTPKAREHEIIAKRQKFVKVKSPAPKKSTEVIFSSDKIKVSTLDVSKLEPPPPPPPPPSPSPSPSPPPPKKIVRKVAPKALNSLKLASKKSPKSSTGSGSISEGAPKPRKKTVNEIDRLLQDEGVVNLLYDVEQPGKRRLVPVTKSQAKVMDIQKVQRELKIRTKLVKNAVLRLRTSATPGAKAPRAKRISAGSISLEDQESPTLKSLSPANEFLFPAKIRNAADASIIVRRHSSSSFSSASGSPRVSIDSTDRQLSFDDGRAQGYPVKSNKRSYPLDNNKKKVEGKKSKKLINDNKLECNESIALYGTQKSRGKGKRVAKSKDSIEDDQDKIDDKKGGTLRSNGAVGKLVKSKKNQKNKVTFAKHTDDHDDEDNMILDGLHKDSQGIDEEQDELSACLAEAVTALANDSSARGKNSVLNRKGKYSREQRSNVHKIQQFSNKEINVQRHGNLVQLILTPSTTSKIRNGMTLQMMHEFKEILSILKKDDDCRVVLLTSTGSSFCEGLELSTLLEDNMDIRRANAQLLANGVKDFIKSLATFNKPIVAGVQGSAVGLGVTMLPLFDLVIASDKASFSTPYGKLGQIAEGAAVFTLSHVLGSAVTSELLLGGRTLTANEALRAGLVTRVLWPDRFHVELLPSLRAMSEQSSQSMEATKALLRHSLRTKLSAALESESYLLVQHWCSTECQNAIRAYMDDKVQ